MAQVDEGGDGGRFAEPLVRSFLLGLAAGGGVEVLHVSSQVVCQANCQCSVCSPASSMERSQPSS